MTDTAPAAEINDGQPDGANCREALTPKNR